jgi:hypothetical protein
VELTFAAAGRKRSTAGECVAEIEEPKQGPDDEQAEEAAEGG